jgi:alkylhydroperoxidase/carboxymuconolactone decarboxylase family protein YurZ
MTTAYVDLLRRLTISDEQALSRVLSGRFGPLLLDEKTSALVGIAALLATDAAEPTYQSAVERAHACGVDDDEILEVALALVPIVGSARMGIAVPQLLTSLGYEVDDAGSIPG